MGLRARRALMVTLLVAPACGRVKAPGGSESDASSAIDAATGAAPPPDACPTDPCVENPFASTGEDGPFAPDGDTVLLPGVYNFTTITIPAGVTVTTEGNARLDLRASGAVVINGVIDVSGARGGDGGVGVSG